eukprot:CAMPEP_0172522206 /NCGR_PEP_ID=MMETSP1066-20121228/292999_1 /TAXON_ID=671091 /ORGANISM="Coscinodiscus wailesii, Strain CCMP2513" /LENGTH=96 /DNA_ID=CAMNT_0013305187 /DNA_START=39 /DNA_END=329 /DNA_ORIENTATION=+
MESMAGRKILMIGVLSAPDVIESFAMYDINISQKYIVTDTASKEQASEQHGKEAATAAMASAWHERKINEMSEQAKQQAKRRAIEMTSKQNKQAMP